MSMIKSVWKAIRRERAYQNKKYPGRVDSLSVGEWLLVLEGEIQEAKAAWLKNQDISPCLAEVLQVAAVAVACLENNGYSERDGQGGVTPYELSLVSFRKPTPREIAYGLSLQDRLPAAS